MFPVLHNDEEEDKTLTALKVKMMCVDLLKLVESEYERDQHL